MEEQFFPTSRLYYVVIEEMNFTITETLRASRVEKWIRAVKRWFLNAAPIKCVGLDCEFTTHEVPQRAADGWRVVDDDDYNQSVGNPKRKV
jgi:hypothetical protein